MSFAGKAVLALFWLMLVPWGAGTVFFRKEKTMNHGQSFLIGYVFLFFCDRASDAVDDLAETAAARPVNLLCGDRSGDGGCRHLAVESEISESQCEA